MTHDDPDAHRFTSGPEVVIDGAAAKRAREELFDDTTAEQPFVPSGPYTPRAGARIPLTVSREQPKPPWLSELHALRELVEAEDAGFRQKSSSHPGRFEPKGTGGKAHAEGDVGQRQVERLAPASIARDHAFVAPWVVSHDPPRSISAALCTRIMVWYLLGRRVDRRIEKRKGTHSERIEATPKAIARELTTELGFDVDDLLVGRIARAGRSAMREYLRDRDLIPRLVRQEHEEHPEMAARTLEQPFDLEGWQEIADFLGINERTAQRYASRAREDDPLPCYVGLGRVVAVKEEVRTWQLRQFRARSE